MFLRWIARLVLAGLAAWAWRRITERWRGPAATARR
jgi:hypothetical protein